MGLVGSALLAEGNRIYPDFASAVGVLPCGRSGLVLLPPFDETGPATYLYASGEGRLAELNRWA